MRAIKTVSEPIGSGELYFSVNDEEVEQPELKAFWDSPVIGCDSWSDFVDAWVGWLKLKGESFLIVDDSWALSVPGTMPLGKLILAKPENMREVVNAGVLVGWEFKDGAGVKRPLMAEQVYQTKLWNPYNDFRGLGEMEAAQLAAETDYGTGQYEGRLAANSGDQGLVVSKKTDGQFSKEQIDQITNALREKRRKLLAGEFKDLFLSADMTVDRPAVSGADVTFQASRITKRHEIFVAFGVPPSLADVKGSYSYGKDSDMRALIVNTCIPTAGKLARVVTKLTKKMTGQPIQACVDFDDHPVMQEVRAERVGVAVSLWGVGVPLKDASDYLTMDLPRVPGDDVGYLPFSVQPVSGQLPELDPAFDETATDSYKPVQEMLRALRNGTHKNGNGNGQHATPTLHTCSGYADIETKGADPRWRKKMIARRATAKQFESRINRVLMEARRETLSKLDHYVDTTPTIHTDSRDNGNVATLLRQAIRTKGVAADFVFDLADFTANFFKGMRAVSANAISTAGNDVWQELGKDDPWNAPPAEVMRYMQNRESKLVNVPADVHQSVVDEIQAGFDAGESKAKIAARIRGTFNEFSQGRANTIAQTETTASYGWADNRAQKDAGVQWREWLTSGLDNVRPDHIAANGQRVSIDEPFNVGGELLDHPGDPNGSPEQVINCHCLAIAVEGENK